VPSFIDIKAIFAKF